MGWLFTPGQTKAQIIAEYTADITAKCGSTYTCLQKKCIGNSLWAVWERKSAVTDEVERWITLTLLRKSGGAWGAKNIDEAMGPCYYDCPLSMLDFVPAKNEGWRTRVQAYHARQAQIKALRPGDVIEFDEPLNFGKYFGKLKYFKCVQDGKKIGFRSMDMQLVVNINSSLRRDNWHVL